jgi:hypothetical protein
MSTTPETTDTPTLDSKQRAKKSKTTRIFKSRYFPVLVVLVLASLPAIYFYNKNRQTQKRLSDPNTANQEVINEVVKKVSRHILLPTGEQPTLASVSDVAKVKDQPFFANAQNDDKVLVYTQARKAYLYRPSKDIIVEVAPLNVGTVNSSSLKQ